ncbi:hypothetical protein SAY86_010193 [Trapa natans]|nr:hypothetical protein SAY86_010193 [Trapa natans]
MGASITKVEALFRACVVVLLVLTACLVGTNAQTKVIAYITKKATYRDLTALESLVYIDVAVAAYSLLQLSRCTISAWFCKTIISYEQKNLAWVCFLLDQAVAYVVFAANTAALQAAMLAITGSKALQWMKLCNRYKRFCFQIGGSLFCGYVACFLLVVISCTSAFNVFRLYSPTKFMQLKQK